MNNLGRGVRRTLLVLPILGVLLVATSPNAVADNTARRSLGFAAEVNAHPVNGRSGQWETPADEVDIWEYQNIVKVDASTNGGRDWIRVELSGPDGAPLRPGVYRDVRHQGEHTATPGILVISNGFGCGEDYAEFTIERIERDATNKLTTLDGTFEHRCGSATAPALRGQFHHRS